MPALLRKVRRATASEYDRSIRALPYADRPSVMLVVESTEPEDHHHRQTGPRAGRRRPAVLLGAADTFRAAAADQLQTWGERVGAQVVRGKENADRPRWPSMPSPRASKRVSTSS